MMTWGVNEMSVHTIERLSCQEDASDRDWREDEGAAAAPPEAGFCAEEAEVLLRCSAPQRSDIEDRGKR